MISKACRLCPRDPATGRVVTVPASAYRAHMETFHPSPSRVYRRSHAWKTLRQFVLERDGYRCRRCGATEDLEVHAMHGHEGENRPEHMVTLCLACHPRPNYGV